MLILVTNDDGIQSPGIITLAEKLTVLGRVVVVAPDREMSAVGHSLTLHSPLRAEKILPDFFAVNGTPTDCIHLGIHGLLDERPDLVVSGINKGGNLGDDLTYSGTVSAAMEATLMGVPAIAVSLVSKSFKTADFTEAADFAARFSEFVISHGLPPDTFLNVNIPSGKLKGVKVTHQGKRIYEHAVVENIDPRGRKYYWIGGGELSFEKDEGSDFFAVDSGYVSITPLHHDLTNYRSLNIMGKWDLEKMDDFRVDPTK